MSEPKTDERAGATPRSIVPTARTGSTGKIVSARAAVRLIRAGDTVALGGFFYAGLALDVVHELAGIFEAPDEGPVAFTKPRDLTLVFCASPGDLQSGGANRLAQPGLVKRVVGGHWTGVPALTALVTGNHIEGYNLPLGPMSHLYRDIAAGKPGHLSRVGLGTFADPRFGGGKLNAMTTDDLTDLVEIGGAEYLFYRAFPINVGVIRAGAERAIPCTRRWPTAVTEAKTGRASSQSMSARTTPG